MNKTTVTGTYCYPEYNFPITLYECHECGAVFLDRDDDYKYCPYCGRKIKKRVNQPEGVAAGLPNGSKRCENSHADAFYKYKKEE